MLLITLPASGATPDNPRPGGEGRGAVVSEHPSGVVSGQLRTTLADLDRDHPSVQKYIDMIAARADGLPLPAHYPRAHGSAAAGFHEFRGRCGAGSRSH